MIKIFNITTVSGKVKPDFRLPFLTKSQMEDFNSIGHTGKTTSGKKISREKYLNSLNKGEFKVLQTRFDEGDYIESFQIVWVESPSLKSVLDEMHKDLSEVKLKILKDLSAEKVETVLYQRHLAQESLLIKYIKLISNNS